MAIDQWLIELSRFCKALSLVIQIFPELPISSKAPAVITHGKVRMRLTGLTDYLLWKFTEKQYQALEGTRRLYWCHAEMAS